MIEVMEWIILWAFSIMGLTVVVLVMGLLALEVGSWWIRWREKRGPD